MDSYTKLQSKIGLRFNDPVLLEQALIHSSYVNESPGDKVIPNERLEFLGDAVLGLWIAERLFKDFPEAPEGTLTKYRSLLVRGDMLSRLAAAIGLGEHLYMGRGEIASGGREKPSNLARALEALIAAIYLDQGYNAAGDFIDRHFADVFRRLENLSTSTDYKSQLQEIIQDLYHTTPEYHIVQSSGEAHHRTFTAEARLVAEMLGTGQGHSKKEAESAAAYHALQRFENTLHPNKALLRLGIIEIEETDMGQRDKSGREQKKVKKDSKKPAISNEFVAPPPPVEVIKPKGKKP